MKKPCKNLGKLVSLLSVLVLGMSMLFTQCKKTETEEVYIHDTVYVDPNDTGIFVPGTAMIDGSWTFDKVHSNCGWESRVYDFSSTKLTGRFNNFNFNPKFEFDETNLSATVCDFFVNLSTFNTGEPGRDGLGKCGLNYVGMTYLDSSKTMVDPLADTARFHVNSVTVDQHEGYVMKGDFTFNRYRSPSGYPDGTPIKKNIDVNLSYNGMYDFDTNGDGVTDRYRAGFTVTFSFYRSDHMDNTSTVPYWPVPTVAEMITNSTTAANNKTYGVWSTSTADKMDITINALFYKNH